MQWELMSNLTDDLAAEILTILLTSSCLLASLSKELPLTRFSGLHRHPSGLHLLSLSPSVFGPQEPRQEAHQGKVGSWAEATGLWWHLGRRAEA